MERLIELQSNVFWFWCCFALSAVTTIIMTRQARHFYYFDGVVKKFSIMNLEFPANASAISNLIKGIRQLPNNAGYPVFNALRSQLYTDFGFMPGVYGGIYFLCAIAATHVNGNFIVIFHWLAYLQFLAWTFDIIENIFLLGQINKPGTLSPAAFLLYRVMESLKWGLSAGAAIAAFSVICYHLI